MGRRIRMIQTAKDEPEAWKEVKAPVFGDTYHLQKDTIRIDSSRKFQKHMGFGGAFTEAAAYTLAQAGEDNRKEIIQAYFDKEKGLAYNLGRTTIHGCDFSLEPYTYIEDNDETLETFDIGREDRWVAPFIKDAQTQAGEKLVLMCSPWSPPAFMKDNHDINHGGRLLKKYYKTWAQYMVKYILEMSGRGFDISMVSVQNEPAAKQIWASCNYNATEEAEFAVDYLFPELQKAGLDSKVGILIWDHNRDLMYDRVRESLAYPKAREIIWGVAYHWYGPEFSENLSMVHKNYPEKHLVFTEGCVELINHSGETSSKAGMGAWKHGEIYGRNIINDFNNYCEAWIDWNLVLNEQGGPNYVGNFCEAPILVDRNANQVIYNNSYYYIGHFSRYIRPNAERIGCKSDYDSGIYSVAYRNPDGEIVVVVQSEMEKAHPVTLSVDGTGADMILPAHSITTFLFS